MGVFPSSNSSFVGEVELGMTDMLNQEVMFGELNEGIIEYRDSSMYLIFAKVFIPCIIPKKAWKKSCYVKNYVASSDEAFMISAFTNCNHW